jgi:hypothetical protein
MMTSVSDPQVAPARSRIRSWRLALLVFAPIAIVLAAAFVVQGYLNAVAPYPKCFPDCADVETLGDTLSGIGAIAAPALVVLAVLALIVRWRLPKISSIERAQRPLSIAIFAILSVLIGAAAYALSFIVYLVPLLLTECQVHGC